MADSPRDNVSASAIDDIEVTAPRPHPVESRSVEISPDGRIGVNMPCPIDRVGPVNLTCGAGVSAFDLAAYGQVRASMPLNELVPIDALRGFRVIAQAGGVVASSGAGAEAFAGVASPPIRELRGASVAAGVNQDGDFRVKVFSRF